MMLSNCCTQYVSKSGRPSSGCKTGKGLSSQFPRQLLSSPMLVRSCLKSCMLGFSITWTKNFQMSKLGLEKEEEPEIKLPTFAGSKRKQGNSRKTSTSVSATMSTPLTVDHHKLWKALKEMRIQDHLTCLLRNPCVGQEIAVRTLQEQLIESRLRKECDRTVCCHPICLTSTLSTSWEIPGWMSYRRRVKELV